MKKLLSLTLKMNTVNIWTEIQLLPKKNPCKAKWKRISNLALNQVRRKKDGAVHSVLSVTTNWTRDCLTKTWASIANSNKLCLISATTMATATLTVLLAFHQSGVILIKEGWNQLLTPLIMAVNQMLKNYLVQESMFNKTSLLRVKNYLIAKWNCIRLKSILKRQELILVSIIMRL